MGRRKIRNYPSKEYYEYEIIEYMKEHREELLHHMLKILGYEDIDSLREDEYKMKFGGDCGFIKLSPKNREMAHEWYLDNDKIPDYLSDNVSCIYSTQSTNIKETIIKKVLEDTELDKVFSVSEYLT